jgi:hypothetical protein
MFCKMLSVEGGDVEDAFLSPLLSLLKENIEFKKKNFRPGPAKWVQVGNSFS